MSGRRASRSRCITLRTRTGSGSAWCSTRMPACGSLGTWRSSRSSGTDRRTGPGRPLSAIATALSPRAATSPGSFASAAHFTIGSKVRTRSISWKASRPRTSRRTCPTIAMTGAESANAACNPIVRFAAPGARPARTSVGRPVSCATASAMNDAAPSCRVVTIRILFAARPSRRPRRLSPGTVKAIFTPARANTSARAAPTVTVALWPSLIDIAALLFRRHGGRDGGPDHRADRGRAGLIGSS